eukprot:s349_g11.t1
MVEGQSNSDLEPNDQPKDRKEFNFCFTAKGGDDEGHHFGPSSTDVNESLLCLVDTACTSCMHSKRWREEYEKSLPDGAVCSMTPSKKVFHFANGQSSENRLSVWRIPIFLDGFAGEVFSAEVPEGNTPLLLSIAAMTALDMVINLEDQSVEVRKLNITMPLHWTKTRHLGLNIAFNLEIGVRETHQERHQPRAISETEDLMVYFAEEARLDLLHHQFLGAVDESSYKVSGQSLQFGDRGVRADDKRGQVSQRRSKELEGACKRISVEDRRTWVALKRDYTVAEQLATDDFKNTVLYEPFAGSFNTTRVATSEFGWTCSQPMDLLDGYDLLSRPGRRLLWNTIKEHKPVLILIVSLLTNCNPGTDWESLRDVLGRQTLLLVIQICKWQDQHGRFYLLENPAGSYAWIFEGLLAKLLEIANGKYVIRDQCCFGKKDAETKQPIRKATGWLGNSEHILNRAICRGLLDAMVFDYSWKCPNFESAFPVYEEDMDTASEGYEMSIADEEDAVSDQWFIDDDGTLVRSHVIPRHRLFVPMQSDETLPVDFNSIQNLRHSIMQYQDGTTQQHTDDWKVRREEDTGPPWTGQTRFTLLHGAVPEATLEEEPTAEELDKLPTTPAAKTSKRKAAKDRTLHRRRDRTRQLQRGFWREDQGEEGMVLLRTTLEVVDEDGGQDWYRVDDESPLFGEWKAAESASTEVTLILASKSARRLKKPQPFLGALEAPLRKSFILLKDSFLCTDWEQWTQMSPAAQIRPLIAKDRLLYVAIFGKELGAEVHGGEEDDRWLRLEEDRQRKWQALPRELKLAVKRIHVNLGHASTPAMLRALRISKASEAALKAVRLFRCSDCPRIQNPKEPRPSKLPITDEFNVQIGMDIIHENDSAGQPWTWLNVFCQATQFQVCVLLDSAGQPTSQQVIEAFGMGWTNWAGFPERGVVADRAKPFLSALAADVADHGCTFNTAAKASPWQIGQIERHGGLWKETFRRVCWAQQVHGRQEVVLTTAAVNQAKNALIRKGGFSPAQWVLGRDVRIPAALCDDQEVMRVGAQALAATPNSTFYRKTELRMAAREAFTKSFTSDALRRAELRQIRPSRGPFLPGMYVFYYDASERDPSPNCWRGIARVIGKEGSSTVWISHRGLLLAVSPEHLSRAYDPEVEHWSVVSKETELMDSTPGAGGTGFIDLRGSPTPPMITEESADPENGDQETVEQPKPLEDVPERPIAEPAEDLNSSSTSMARIQLESDREQKRSLKSHEFFDRMAKQRRMAKQLQPAAELSSLPSLRPEEIPIPEDEEFDPEADDYHQALPSTTTMTRQRSPFLVDPAAEASEREAKRLRLGESPDHASFADARQPLPIYMATYVPKFLEQTATANYLKHDLYYEDEGISISDFVFGVRRNDFYDKYEALANAGGSGDAQKKKGRKEIKLPELSQEQQQLFTGAGGSDEREWAAWQAKEACDVLSLAESLEVRKHKPDLIVPSRWVRTNKHDGLVGKDRLSCEVETGGPRFTLFAKDIKNAYFSGKSVSREVYIDQPRGGLKGLQTGQLLRARKAIYGFSEAARMFWLALKEHLENDGWRESKLEPALFYLRHEGQLHGILVTHVDDIEGGMSQKVWDSAFAKSSLALEFATNHVGEFIFRGREIKQGADKHIDISMLSYALSMRNFKLDRDRKKQLDDDLKEDELELMNSVAGELGWLTRQLRCDLVYENGVIQRCKSEAIVADLVRLKQYVGAARRGADFRLRFWSDVDLKNGVIIHLADSGHANGTPEKNAQMRYRSVGGYFILIADRRILEGETVRCNILSFHSGQTKRVCRSTLAAEASHLAEAVECGDWVTVLIEEALTGDVDLENWSSLIERRQRVYVTDAKSVYDYLQKDATSTSTDKRMAIEGALLRETCRKDGAHVRWIDGPQNIANVLTKHNAEKDTLRQFLRDGMMSLQQTEENRKLKEKQRAARQKISKAKLEDTTEKDKQRQQRRQAAVADVQEAGDSSEAERSESKENTGSVKISSGAAIAS